MAAPRRSGLGRGLSSLIPSDVSPVADAAGPVAGAAPGLATGEPALRDVAVGDIIPNPHQPRRTFDEEALTSLTASVRELGVLQPVLVRPGDDGGYVLVAGERRWRAARRAGLPTIPALVKVLDDTASLEQAVVENLHRQDLNALEEAAAYQQLIEEFGLTHELVAVRVGKSRAAITNALRLFQLPPSVQRLVAEGQLTAGHAKALLGTPDRAFLEHLAARVVTEGLTVRDVENAVRARGELELGGTGGSAPADAPTTGRSGRPSRDRASDDPGVLELEQLLASFLDTRVSIQLGKGPGKLVVDFADLEDLERIYRTIAHGAIDAPA